MRITREALTEAASKAVGESFRAGGWEVWPSYGLAGPLGDPSAPRYLRARPASLEADRAERYAPLVLYPDLYLKFARLADDGGLDVEPDTEKNAQAALEWAHGYGVLGLTAVDRAGDLKANTRGGAGDTVEAFAREAWIAHDALAVYEAATAADGPDVEEIASYIAPRRRDFFTQTPEMARDWAMNAVTGTVQEKVASGVYPALYTRPGGGHVQGLDFTSLLGAMWLQAFWLLSADPEQQRRCRWCNRVIAFRQPEQPKSGTKPNDRSGGYRTRRDKQFCSARCRNKNHYAQRARR